MTAIKTDERMMTPEQRADAFGERLGNMMNEAALALMTSIGHRTGLFDVMAKMPPSTSEQIAAKANLSERYVREWLGAMTTGRIVGHDHDGGTYWLPEAHAQFLTREATPMNIAQSMQWFAVLGAVEDHVVQAFRDGKGVPYDVYPRFHEVMAAESDQTVIAGLFDHILPLVPGIVDRLERGIDVVDVGCGVGRAVMAMAERYPNSRFTGVDFFEPAIEEARKQAAERGLTNVTFDLHDATTWDRPEQFDLVVTFDAIHDQMRPDLVLENINRALRPGGVYMMQDIGGCSCHHDNLKTPMAPFIYTISCMHCMSVSLANGGMGLGAAWGKQLATQMLEDAGFNSVSIRELEHDAMNYYYICPKSESRS